ncbi:MAG: hypothetical protein J0I49_12240 [Pseudonocardia sp.]|uniref:hypothetical protein n=1 Tax=Pseudonocardia sp. TaxID=60912 RepID=UPI001AC15AE1|nr:hypothetical protein [Pseudonocardia sp.]MBN9098864.1 hypothetical protein [Pseudonocardia sp.]
MTDAYVDETSRFSVTSFTSSTTAVDTSRTQAYAYVAGAEALTARALTYGFGFQSSQIPVHPVMTDGEERAYVSRLWAEDWDSDEDAVYDTYE